MEAAMKGPCIPYEKMGLNMAANGFICASLLFRALGDFIGALIHIRVVKILRFAR